MALWSEPKIFLCSFIFVTFCCSLSVSQMPIDCCLSTKNKRIDKKLVADYREQAKGCSLPAMILVTRRGRELCTPPNEPWLQEVMKHVDHLKKLCKKKNYQHTRCFGVKPE
uniref:C-C motif chemokine n=2 Tax=Nothobranchius korthausae TaxID=1143690 RepID=A0A1A8FBF2_9TELE